MKNLFKTSVLSLSVVFGLGVADIHPNVSISSVYAEEAAEEVKETKKRRRTPALGSRVYSQLARAQGMADAGDVQGGLEVLDNVKAKAKSLNSYEMAMLYNFYGFIYYNAENLPEAIKAFEQVVAQQPIPESLEKSTLFSLSQLAMANGQYQKTLAYLEKWEQVNEGKIPFKNYVLKAQATYQAKQYERARDYIKMAIDGAIADGFSPDENWYVLQRAVFFELKQPVEVTKVLEIMVRRFNKPEYWVQLSGMYGETGQEKKQLAVMEAAYQQGFVTKKSDVRNLSQIYYLNDLPYKAAKVMEKGIEDKILEANDKNLRFMAQAWLAAKEYDKSVATYEVLAAQIADGTADQQIAEIRLQQGKFLEVVSAANKAVNKGGLTNPGNVYLALGMANFNLKRFDQAIQAFNSAKGIKSSKNTATQWLKYVAREQANQQLYAQAG